MKPNYERPQDHARTGVSEGNHAGHTEEEKNGNSWFGWRGIRAFIYVGVWIGCYLGIEDFAHWVVFQLFGASTSSHFGEALEFFIYDTAKILLLLVALIYVIAFLRVSLDMEFVKKYIGRHSRIPGYFLGAFFGGVTPFCSCSSIPLFLGFNTAGIPFGVTMAFLITSPLINEIALVLLWGLLGWKFALVYVVLGVCAGVLGGLLADMVGAVRWLQPFMLEAMAKKPLIRVTGAKVKEITLEDRHNFALAEMRSIFGQVWKWVIVGVAIGAVLHGFVPEDWFARNFAAREWWTVPCAVLVGIPLYSNVTGIVPIMESLLQKGLPMGTTLAFCMSAVAASIPEVILLRRIMTVRLQMLFMGYLWVIFTLFGWFLNFVEPWLRVGSQAIMECP